MAVSTDERFWSKVDRSGECWLWTAYTFDGYGRFRLNGESIRAHHYVMGRPPTPGWEVDHTCRNRACVRPSHLEWVPKKINIERIPPYSRGNSEKTVCLRGHTYDLTNTRITKSGTRACRACDRERKRVA